MLLSVIIPVYNAGDYLKKCLDSILCQRAEEFELILVDDGSRDGSGAVCDEYAAKDPRVRVIHKENGGQVGARRMGIHAAAGEYIGYVDADDAVRPDWLETIGACLREGEWPDILAFGIAEHSEEGTKDTVSDLPEGRYDRRRLEREVFPYAVCDRRRVYTSQLIFPVAWNKVYKRELLLEHCCRDDRIRRGEDTAFVYECLLSANSLYVTHRVLYDYNRAVPTSISGTFGLKITENDLYLAEYLKKRLAGFGVDGQINDFILCRLIRSVLWKAKYLTPKEAKAALKTELSQIPLVDQVRFRGLPAGPALFLLALKMRLYGPLFFLARKKNGQ